MGRSIVNRRLITATLARARDPETLSVHQMLGRERKSRDLVRIFCMVMEGPDVHLGSARHLRTVIRGRPPKDPPLQAQKPFAMSALGIILALALSVFLPLLFNLIVNIIYR